MNEEQEITRTEESPEWHKYRIDKEVELEAENRLKLAEMDKQIAYTEKIQLRELKLQAFKLAKDIKPSYNAIGQSFQPFTASDLIREAELIYQSLIK